ncbi:MAG: flagellar filament capping protein FliD [Proteobacteria bacterium]|nr:flagellar filament capping protein FliD [Pseudomonadota bacterium]
MAVSSTSSPVSIANSNSTSAAAGGSVIDVNTLVSQLVAASRAGQDATISKQTQAVTTKISALGTLKSALSTFQDSLATISTPAAFNAETATSANPAVFTAQADSNATQGSYSISVGQLASAQQLVSKPFIAGASTPIGTGTLQVSLGANSFNITVGATNNTLAGIASAINSAAGNPGVTATVINGTDGAHLVLSSAQTGAANTIKVAETDGGTALAAVTYDPANTVNYTENSQAKDAQFNISGVPHTSQSNTVTDALNGITLTLTGVSAAGTTVGTLATSQLTVASDTPTILTNVGAFVDAYNAMVKAIQPLGSFDQTTQTAGPMLGDPTLSGVQNDIRSALYSVVNTGSTTYNTLASVGITTNKDGSLSLNKTKLQSALASAPTAVSQLFSGTTGVAATLNNRINSELGAGGSIDSRSKTLIKQENALTDQTNKLNTQMAALTASLTQQYSHLNTLLSSLQSMSAYLSQQFNSLPKVQSSN